MRILNHGAPCALRRIGLASSLFVVTWALASCGQHTPNDFESSASRTLAPPHLAISLAKDYSSAMAGLQDLLSREKNPAKAADVAVNRDRPAHFMIDGYRLPSPDQLDAGSCLYMTGTGIMEWLINRSKGFSTPPLDGRTDLSERFTLTLASRIALNNDFTDVVYLFQQSGTYALDRDLKFTLQNDSAMVNWQPINETTVDRYTDIPKFSSEVLFTSNGKPRTNGVMKDADIERIKAALVERNSPILFVFHPPTVAWWHADMIVGYDDAKGVFYARDSAFGQKRTDLPFYDYGVSGEDLPYRDIYELKYKSAKAWGNHATQYFLDQDG